MENMTALMADIKEAVDATEDFNGTPAKFPFNPGAAKIHTEIQETDMDKKCEKNANENTQEALYFPRAILWNLYFLP